jgi:hypothetical protein
MGLRALRKIQIGEETTGKGTAMPATAALLGTLTMKSSPTIHRPVEERGSLAEFARSINVANLAELSFEGDATFQQILYLLHMGVLGNVTPAADGTNGKKWTFTPAMLAAGVFDAFTIEYGDDVQAWETEFCMARSIEISGAMNEAMHMRASIFGRKMTATTFTPALQPPSVESIPFQKAKLYIDAEAGTIGTTEKASSLIACTYAIKTGLGFKRYADGSIDFTTYSEQFKGVDLKMTFAFNTGAEAERVLFDGETLRLVRIRADGSAIAGGSPSQHRLDLDFCGIYTDFATLAERDGEDIVEVTMSTQRGATYTKLFEITVINTLDTLP